MTSFKNYTKTSQVGRLVSVNHPIVTIQGIEGARLQESLLFEKGQVGQVQSLERDYIHAVMLNRDIAVVGTKVVRTKKRLSIRIGFGTLGRTIDPLGKVLDKSPFDYELTERKFIDVKPPKLTKRTPVNRPFETGVRAVDLMNPLGLGQRELIIGQRKVGKSEFLKQVSLNFAINGGIVVYAAIAKRTSELADLREYFESNQLLHSLVMVETAASDSPGLIFLTPYSAMSVAEFFRDRGKDVLVIMDDMSIHARAYRTISLLLRRFPGRGSYPGDVFFVQSKLMERAGSFIKGSITALPVAELSSDSLSDYIPTNLMAMTDGHMYFDKTLYNKGRKPAINPLLSVTRVGHQTSTKLYRSISREVSSYYAGYMYTSELAHFGGEMGSGAREILVKGKLLDILLNQSTFDITPTPVTYILAAGIWSNLWRDFKEEKFASVIKQTQRAYSAGSKGKFFQDVNNLLKKVESLSVLCEMLNQNNTLFDFLIFEEEDVKVA